LSRGCHSKTLTAIKAPSAGSIHHGVMTEMGVDTATNKTENGTRLDVRADVQEGREPFTRIMDAVAKLRFGQSLLIIAPFRPLPLFSILARQGLSHEARLTPSGDWEVLFTRCSGDSSASEKKSVGFPSPASGESAVEIDVRDLEPPPPLAAILKAIEELPRLLRYARESPIDQCVSAQSGNTSR
jgi:uncharacterized protein (DUF2249 family)